MMNPSVMDGLWLISLNVPKGFKHQAPLFQEPPEDVDERWTHGAMVGGLAWLTEQADIARSYRRAAEALIEKAVDERRSWEIVYPVLFLYRHAIEITLKSLFPGAPQTHPLNELIERADGRIRAILPTYEADWIKGRLSEFAEIDPRSTAFRYEGAALNSRACNGGEWWVDFPHLRQTMAIILQLLEVLTWGGDSKEERSELGNPQQPGSGATGPDQV